MRKVIINTFIVVNLSAKSYIFVAKCDILPFITSKKYNMKKMY